MGAAITATNPADFANRLQKHFSKPFLKTLLYELRLGSYGVAKELESNSAANTIRFFRPRRAKKAVAAAGVMTGPQALTEGTPIATAQANTVNVGYVDVQLQQRGDLTSISDIVRAIDLFNTMDTYSKTMAADAALDFDFVCSRAICSQPGVADADTTPNNVPAQQTTMYNYNTNNFATNGGLMFNRYAGVNMTGVDATDWGTLSAASLANSKLTRAVHLGAVTRLRGTRGKPRVPTIGGRYVCLAPPEVFQDIRQDSTWLAAAVFDSAKLKDLYKWGEFDLDGCVFVENQSPFMEKATYGVYDNTGTGLQTIYSLIYLGMEAFGVPKLSGSVAGSDPRSPSLILLTQPDKSDPANQIVTIAWKAYYQAALLLTSEATDVPHLCVQRCKSTFIG